MRLLEVSVMVVLLFPAFPATAAEEEDPRWLEGAFFGLHYDLHPGPGDTELGRGTTSEHIRSELEKVRPDFVQYDCKGHGGWSGYPTAVGSPSPGIVRDALAVWRAVTRDMGIPLSIHFSGVWDNRAIELHPEWAVVRADGSRDERITCLLSGYREELMVPQLLEVIGKYELDGVWVDGENWAAQPCWCDRCGREFEARTGVTEPPAQRGEKNWDKWLAFHRDLFEEHVTAYTRAIHAEHPEVAVCSNWMYSVRQPDPVRAPVSYLSGDFDPSFGSERASAEARFLAGRGLHWNLMAWSFLQTGNIGWTTKPAPHLCQEVAQALAQGGGVFVYNQPQRSGHLTGWQQDILAEVADFCRKRRDVSFQTETVPQVALLHSANHFYRHCAPLYNFAEGNRAMEGALHAILENGYSVDILNEETLVERMEAYPIVVVPEQEGLSPAFVARLRDYVRQGGHALLTGPRVAEEYPEMTGTTPVADTVFARAYVPAGNGTVTVAGQWQAVDRTTATEIAPLLVQQEPLRDLAGTPAATVNRYGQGTVVAVHGTVFTSYHQSHYPGIRGFVGSAMSWLEPLELIRLDGPWWVEMSARRKDGRLLLHFVNRSASGHLAPNRHMVEHVPDAGSFSVTVPIERRPLRCSLHPDKAGLEWAWKDGVLTAHIDGLQIHNVLVIELAQDG